MNKTIKGIHCKFVTSVPRNHHDNPDYHLVKETIVYEDGTEEPNLRLIKDFKRPFWVTKKGFRNHQSKKSTETLDKLDEYWCTQSSLRDSVAAALGKSWSNDHLRKLANSPYLYGADISSTVFIKKKYQDKYPDTTTLFSVCAFDVETDMVAGHEEIMMATVTMGSKVFTAVRTDAVKGISSPIKKIDEKMELYLGEYIKSRKLECETVIVENELDVVFACINKAHEWKPDFLSIWNMDFEMTRILKACEKAGVDPANIFSDPDIHKSLRFFKYKQGSDKQTTASGKVKPRNMADRWHTVFAPSSFYVIDAMCTYRQLRLAKAEEVSYSLDSILEKNLGIRKLKFKEADHLVGAEWHEFMQTNYPVEYIVYNRFDVISMLILDEKILDLRLSLPKAADLSHFSNFSSQPTKVCIRYHFYLEKNGSVIGTTGSEMQEEADTKTMDLEDWILALDAGLNDETGIKNLIEDDELATNIRLCVYDSDVSSGYPSAEIAANSSKETTKREVVEIEGIDMYVAKMSGIDLVNGHVNAAEYCQTLMNLPSFDNLLVGYINRC